MYEIFIQEKRRTPKSGRSLYIIFDSTIHILEEKLYKSLLRTENNVFFLFTAFFKVILKFLAIFSAENSS